MKRQQADSEHQVDSPSSADVATVQASLIECLVAINSAAKAEAVIERLVACMADKTVDEVATQARGTKGTSSAQEMEKAAHAIAQSKEIQTDEEKVATTLERVAAEAAALDEQSYQKLVEVIQTVNDPGFRQQSQSLEQARKLLLEAILQHPQIPVWQKLDTKLFVFFTTHLPRSPQLDRICRGLSFIFKGGWVWSIGVILFVPFRRKEAWATFKQVSPPVLGTAFLVERLLKALTRRQRSSLVIIEEVVVGKKAGHRSLPSGHTAAAFAGAHALSRCVPRLRLLWYAIASVVAYSRLYLGAHYPGEVLLGAGLGFAIATLPQWLRHKLA